MRNTNNLKTDQSGVVSFISVMMLSIVLVMITISFVKASTSNLREALDNQLATQAFYAAESGVNDAINALGTGITDEALMNFTDCTGINSFMDGAIKPYRVNKYDVTEGSNFNQLNTTGPIKYSCVLINNQPTDVTFEPGANGKIYIIKSGTTDAAGDAVPINSLKISWGTSGQVPLDSSTHDNQNLPIDDSSLVPSGSTMLSMLRLSFYYPYQGGGVLTRTNLINNQKTFYLKPISAAASNSSVDVGSELDGSVVKTQCIVGSCSLIIKNISAIDASNTGFYLRTIPLYNINAGTVTIEGYSSEDASGDRLQFKEAQYSIDVTARAGDVYKRVDYRFSQDPQFDFPTTAAMSGGGAAGDLCKQFVVWPGDYVNEASPACVFN